MTACRRVFAVGFVAVVMAAILVGVSPPRASASQAEGNEEAQVTSTSLQEFPDGAGRIIQRPNSGVAPEDSGDRGGVAQVVVFVLLVAAVGGGVGLVVRESRRKRPQA